MAIVKTVKAPEQFLVEVNGGYDIMFEEVEVTVAGALASGTVLADAATEATGIEASVIGILADDKPAGTATVRVMTKGNPSKVRAASLSTSTAAIVGALEALDIFAV
jgi:hypothetical protein